MRLITRFAAKKHHGILLRELIEKLEDDQASR